MCPQVGIFPWSRPMPHDHSGIGMGGFVSHLVLTDRPKFDVRNWATIALAVAAIGATESTLFVPTVCAVTANLTFPDSLTLEIQQGGGLDVATGITATIEGTLIAGNYGIFTFAGTGRIAGLVYIKPEWFGVIPGIAVGTAVSLANWQGLQRSIDLIGNGGIGGEIEFQPGRTYEFGRDLLIWADNLFMNGNYAILKKDDGSGTNYGESIFITGANTAHTWMCDINDVGYLYDGSLLVYGGANAPIMNYYSKNLIYDGEYGAIDLNIDCLAINGAHNLLIEGGEIREAQMTGLRIEDWVTDNAVGNKNIIIRKVWFHDNCNSTTHAGANFWIAMTGAPVAGAEYCQVTLDQCRFDEPVKVAERHAGAGTPDEHSRVHMGIHNQTGKGYQLNVFDCEFNGEGMFDGDCPGNVYIRGGGMDGVIVWGAYQSPLDTHIKIKDFDYRGLEPNTAEAGHQFIDIRGTKKITLEGLDFNTVITGNGFTQLISLWLYDFNRLIVKDCHGFTFGIGQNSGMTSHARFYSNTVEGSDINADGDGRIRWDQHAAGHMNVRFQGNHVIEPNITRTPRIDELIFTGNKLDWSIDNSANFVVVNPSAGSSAGYIVTGNKLNLTAAADIRSAVAYSGDIQVELLSHNSIEHIDGAGVHVRRVDGGYSAASPTTGYHYSGDRLWEENASVGNCPGWICTFDFAETTTAPEPAGETVIAVVAHTGVAINDIVGIKLDNGAWHWTHVTNLDTVGCSVSINAGIPVGRTSPNGTQIVYFRFEDMANLV